MPEPEPPDPLSQGPGTQGSPGAESGATILDIVRRERPKDSNPSSDTLLSAPAPASKDELARDERLTACERRVDELAERLERLERRPPEKVEPRERGWWIWLVFLAGLAIAWQILRLLGQQDGR